MTAWWAGRDSLAEHRKILEGIDRVSTDPVDLHIEACKNARLLTRICDVLDRHHVDQDIVREIRSTIFRNLRDPEVEGPIDYDPDIHGWPWESDHV